MIKIKLTPSELVMGSTAGATRHIISITKGYKDAHGYDGEDGWTKHIEGACGEIACAKALGRYWSPTVNTFNAPDLAMDLQVRTRSRTDYELYVRPDDNETHAFVLVLGRAPDFIVRGWMFGHEAKRPEWLKDHGGRPPAWFVPNGDLHPIGDLALRDKVAAAA